jgi:hypothetical protein
MKRTTAAAASSSSSSSSKPATAVKSAANQQLSPIEQLIYRLCLKIAAANNLTDRTRDEFVSTKYTYLIKLFCSDAYSPVYDAFEISEKIRKKRVTFYLMPVSYK